MNASPLDDPVWASLTGPHARFAERCGQVLRYSADVAPFVAVTDEFDDGWRDVAELAGPGGTVVFAGRPRTPPPGWDVLERLPGVQLVDERVVGAADAEAVRLTAADLPEMHSLIERTKPGPFLPRTHELGTYLGIRRGGALVAMAGERMHPPGWTEISAVCTDPAFRGQGLATRLVLALAASIHARGETPFLHAVASNTGAIRLYEALGFRLRQHLVFAAIRVPAS
ncbi:GNAT family N-acetyltransferase [Saccharopolyspora sp. 5N708]|uniref:GNAT family N-acetyltransferase n=1 Tax=Saccharopolyspora sp. 5N708 TaxID=3457424 RepID=UPI003FD285C8